MYRAILLMLFAGSLWAQTTQGLISGRLLNSITGRPIGGASVGFGHSGTAESGQSVSDAEGYYYLPLLSPGVYRVQVTATGFQAQEVQELTLPVAGRIELDFRMRPLSDVFEAGQYRSVFLPGSHTIVTFYGPDVDTSRSGSFEAQQGRLAALESTVSDVVDSPQIDHLPLSGRDVYTMLVLQPGVTSGGATARGLGLSINGQRPSASNYLLDGLENNNYLITGPLSTVAPEVIQEYRVSTNNFSAEYGRTSGFLANAITRSGTDQFHGVAYLYLKNDVLNANGFQQNLAGKPRTPAKELQPGFLVGGPILKSRLNFSSALERFRSRSFQDPFKFSFPAPGIFGSTFDPRNSFKLLKQFAPPPVVGRRSATDLSGDLTIAPPVSIDRALAIERVDYNSPNGKERVLARVIIQRLTRPDFIWSPYPDFTSPLKENTVAPGVTYTHMFRATLTNEARVGYSDDNLFWTRAHPEIPTLTSGDGTMLPGSPAFYEYSNRNRSWEFLDNLLLFRGRHLFTAGAGLLLRRSSGHLTAGRDAQFLFSNVLFFALDRPSNFRVPIQRSTLPGVQLPSSDRTFSYQQYFGFVQDTYKVSSRLTLNYGLRYEVYTGPHNVGPVKDLLIDPGPGATLAEQLTTATLAQPRASSQELFGADLGDFGVRTGASYDLTGRGRTVLRGGYGIFYDRPYDNLWQNLRNNNFILPLLSAPGGINFLAPPSSFLPALAGTSFLTSFPELTMVDTGLKNGYAHSYFAGVQHRFSDQLTVEANSLGSFGRRLIATDIVNRDFSTPPPKNCSGICERYNAALPDIAYRSARGFSDYSALAVTARYRAGRAAVQGTYTWSHTIDNQSDALSGDFFNLSFASIASSYGSTGRSAFSQQFNPLSDRASSDYDQRQNFVAYAYWDTPAIFTSTPAAVLFRGWTFSGFAAVRSGFPFTVIGAAAQNSGQGYILNPRPNIVDLGKVYMDQEVPGGRRLLNGTAFANAAPSTLGNAGRNAFNGPGFYNLDVAVTRSFGLRWLGESGRLRLRADAFNVLNHTNLGSVGNVLNITSFGPDATFGVAKFGRQENSSSGFPAVSPLSEGPRTLQLSVKIEF